MISRAGSGVRERRLHISNLIDDLAVCNIVRGNARESLCDIGRPAVGPLIAALTSDRWYVRYDTAIILGKIGDVRAIPHLVSLLYDNDRNVRAATANALGVIGGYRICKRLSVILRSTKFRPARDAAAFALGMTGEKKYVIAALDYIIKNRKRRQFYKSAFIAIGSAAVPVLCDVLLSGGSKIREETAEILGEIMDRRAVQPLTRSLKDPSRAVRIASAYSLGRLNDKSAVAPLCAALADATVDVRHAVCIALGNLRDKRAIPHLIKAFSNPAVTAAAAAALKDIGKPSIMPLLACLHTGAKATQAEVIKTLGELGDKIACRPLLRFLETEDKALVLSAATALGELNDRRAIPALVRLLDNNDTALARAAAAALRNVGGRKACDALRGRLIITGDSAAQLAASSERARRIYAKDAEEGDWYTRLRAVHRLMSLGDKRAIEPLRKLLNDKDRNVRRNAADLVFMLPQAEVADDVGRLISAGELGGGYGLSILSRIGIPAMDAMRDVYKSGNPYRRSIVLRVGQRLRDIKFIAMALDGLEDKDPLVRREAKSTLDFQIGTKQGKGGGWKARYYEES